MDMGQSDRKETLKEERVLQAIHQCYDSSLKYKLTPGNTYSLSIFFFRSLRSLQCFPHTVIHPVVIRFPKSAFCFISPVWFIMT